MSDEFEEEEEAQQASTDEEAEAQAAEEQAAAEQAAEEQAATEEAAVAEEEAAAEEAAAEQEAADAEQAEAEEQEAAADDQAAAPESEDSSDDASSDPNAETGSGEDWDRPQAKTSGGGGDASQPRVDCEWGQDADTTLAFRVIDRESKEPVGGVFVEVYNQEDAFFVGKTLADGTRELVIKPGSYSACVWKPWHDTIYMTVEAAGPESTYEVELSPHALTPWLGDLNNPQEPGSVATGRDAECYTLLLYDMDMTKSELGTGHAEALTRLRSELIDETLRRTWNSTREPGRPPHHWSDMDATGLPWWNLVEGLAGKSSAQGIDLDNWDTEKNDALAVERADVAAQNLGTTDQEKEVLAGLATGAGVNEPTSESRYIGDRSVRIAGKPPQDPWPTQEASFQVQIVTPSVEQLPPEVAQQVDQRGWRQYVNMPPDLCTQANQGSRLTVRVGTRDGAQPHPEDVVHLQVEFGPENSKRNDPLPAVYLEGEALTLEENVAKATVPFGDDGVVEFELELGYAGGDSYTISVGGTPTCEDDRLELTTWRQVYCQLSKPKGFGEVDRKFIDASLAQGFIELDCYRVVEYDPDDPAAPRYTWIDDGELLNKRLSGKTLIFSENSREYLSKGDVDLRNDLSFHWLITDVAIEVTDKYYVPLVSDFDGEVEPGQLVDFDGQQVPGVVLSVKKACGDGARAYPYKLVGEPGPALSECTWEGEGWGDDGTIPLDHVQMSYGKYKDVMTIKLPEEAVQCLEDGPVQVRGTMSFFTGDLMGKSFGGACVLTTRAKPHIMAAVLAHEIGHAIGMTCPESRVPPGLQFSDHGWWYDDDRGHTGNHCAMGVPNAVYTDTRIMMDVSERYEQCWCLMFGTMTTLVAKNNAFCDKCKLFMRAVHVERPPAD